MNINFVFDRISDHGIPVGNVLCFKNFITPEQLSFTKDLPNPPWKGFFFEYVSSNFNDTFKNNADSELTKITNYIKTSEIENYTNDLNIYPIFTHGVGLISAFTLELLYYVDRNVINAVNNDNLKIVLLNLYDPWVPPEQEFISKLLRICYRIQLKNKKNLILACSDNDEWVAKTTEILSSYGSNSPKILNSYWWEKITKSYLNSYHKTNIDYLKIYNNVNKNKIFTHLINRPTNDRYFLYKYLEKENLLSYGYVSVRQPMNFENFDQNFYHVTETALDQITLNNFKNYLQNNKNIEINLIEENNNDTNQNSFCPRLTGTTMDRTWIKNSLFTIYSETDFEKYFLSEKTYKLFYYCHPFIIYGKKGILKKIQTLGYKTFPMLFDESYDDYDHRSISKLKLIVDQIKFFTTEEGKEKFNKVLPEVCGVLEHNRKKLLNSNAYDFWIKINNS